MVTTPVLTDTQIADFERDGYVVVPGAFGPDDMAVIERWAHEVEALPEEPGRHWVFHEKSRLDDSDLINRIEYIAPYHDGFAELTQLLEAPAAQLFGEDVSLFKEKINFKMPGGGGFEPHQDSQAGWGDYASNFVNVMICIDEATIENGCLELAPGQNRRGLLRGMEPLTDQDTRDMKFVTYPTKPGDMVLFDAYAPHRSEPNPTNHTRRMYFATYNKASEGYHLDQYYADKRKNFPPDIERDPDKEYVYKV
ncbi:MAG: phytanoyl-CoA dioxygenase family protein [Rhodospirillaceae bacterium]|jgi:2-aminoethylphosphonate dioxygenase|nr:phytanoyl-CoA dioxygenase family protein [Rhodospirillaceae bacterium]